VRRQGRALALEHLQRRLDAAVEEPLATAEEDRGDAERELVELAGGDRLADGRGPARDVDLAVRRLPGHPERVGEAGRDEVERRPARHLDRRSLVVGEHEHRRVVRRLLAPPAPPRSQVT
jgi:hypothetical protein